MKKYAILLASVLWLSSAVYAEPIEIASSAKQNTVWVMYLETFTRLQDGFSVLVAERDLTGRANENRVYAGVMRETCTNKHGSLYARVTPQGKWEPMSTVTLGSPSTVADITANVICAIGNEIDKKSPPEKRKLTV